MLKITFLVTINAGNSITALNKKIIPEKSFFAALQIFLLLYFSAAKRLQKDGAEKILDSIFHRQ